MLWTKIKLTALTIMCLALLGTGAGLVAHRALAVDSSSGGSAQEPSQVGFLVAEQEKEGQEGKSLKGTLKSIDVKKGVVIVTTQRDGEGKKDHTLSLAGKDIKVTSNVERPVKLEDLKAGDRVTAYLSPADDVTAIRVEITKQGGKKGPPEGGKERPSQVYGVIKSVDPAKRTVTLIQLKDGGVEIEKTFEVAKGTPDRPWKGKDLAEWEKGQKVFLLIGENQLVTAIQTKLFGKERPKEGGKEGAEGRSLNGELVSVDKTKQTITVLQRTDGGPKEKTLDLDKNVKVQLGREEKGSLDDLKKGAKLTLTLKEGKVIAIRPLQTGKEKPGLQATLKKIDAKEGTITVGIKGEGGAEREKEFTLSKEAKIIIPGKENVSVNDLKEDTRVLLQIGNDRQTVVGIRVIKDDEE